MKILGIAGNSSAGKDTIANILVEKHKWQVVAFADELKRLCGRIFDYDADTLFGEPANRNRTDPRAANVLYWDLVGDRVVQEARNMRDLFCGHVTPEEIIDALMPLLVEFEGRGDQLTPRHVLQQMGTEWGRKLWPDVWINRVKEVIQAIKEGSGYTRTGGLVTFLLSLATPPGVITTDSRFPNEAEAIHAAGGKMLWVDASVRVPKDPKLAHASEPERRDFRIKWGDEERDLIDYDLDNNGSLSELTEKIDIAIRALWS